MLVVCTLSALKYNIISVSGVLLLVTLMAVGVTGGEDYQWDHNVAGVLGVVNLCAPVETCGCVENA